MIEQFEYEKGKLEKVIKTQGFFAGTTVGVSMYPMLRNRRDTIIIKPVTKRLEKYDVPVYTVGDRYVMHRIIKVLPDAYIIRGDNCLFKEHVTDNMIIGVLTEFYRNPKNITSSLTGKKTKNKPVNMDGICYKAYVRIWQLLFPIRLIYKRLRSFVGTCIAPIKKRFKKI